MRPLLLEIPAKPAFFILLAAGVLLALAGQLVPFVKKRKELKSMGPTLLVAALIAARVGTGQWQFWAGGAFDKAWDPVPIFSYGVMLGLSLVVGWYIAMWLADQDGLSRQGVAQIYVWTAVVAVIGARVLYVLTNLDHFKNPIDMIKVNEGGLVAYGGFLGGFFASWYWCRKNGWSLLRWADVGSVPVALGLSITRVGCLLYGCDFGGVTKQGWGITFPGPTALNKMRGSPAWQRHVHDLKLLPDTAAQSLPVHPTQIYETLLGIFIVIVLLQVRKRRRFSGEVFVAFTMIYGIARFLIEFLRDDAERGEILGLSTSQAIGLVSSMAALALWIALWNRWKQNRQLFTYQPLAQKA